MDSPSFYSLVKNFTCLTEGEYESIKGLSREYPYSQIINLLKARAAQDLNHTDKVTQLHFAALYSTERSVLKQVMTRPKGKRVEVAVPAPVLAEVPEYDAYVQESIPPVDYETETVSLAVDREVTTLSGDALIEDIYAELGKLQKLKKAFALSVEAFESGVPVKINVEKEVTHDPLIEQIKTTKKKLKVENPKQKEQNDIIDKFIKTQPSIPKPKPAEPASDLSEEASIFGDHIVSETLVEILLKQGKKDKAVEVLKEADLEVSPEKGVLCRSN